MQWCLLMLLALGLGVSGGCASKSPPAQAVVIKLPPSLREACLRARLPEGDAVTIGALASFSVEQEAALAVCDAKRAAVVAIVDAHAQAVTPKPRKRVTAWIRERF